MTIKMAATSTVLHSGQKEIEFPSLAPTPMLYVCPSVKCVALAHHALAHDWYNISLVTIADAEWLVHFALCMIDSSQ